MRKIIEPLIIVFLILVCIMHDIHLKEVRADNFSLRRQLNENIDFVYKSGYFEGASQAQSYYYEGGEYPLITCDSCYNQFKVEFDEMNKPLIP